ncbi:hypothetical protein CBER1_10738 [Cercospora berteroae]|uniref:Uncharacterized protein n=1 Tax=Cercospora berteroae TaxID=357750 RepID=A0A2S6BY09_9PEZI|nr:hypothetical protein CBER1_10738 [Cercospora berteroae]
MPARHRAPQARHLPTSRLPVGTPEVTTERPLSRSSGRSSKNTAETLNLHESTWTQSTYTTMSTSDMALAQAKLRRQQERIQQAEAALYNPPPAEKVDKPRYDPSRAKAKLVWKPIDLGDRIEQRTRGSESGVEVRINKYSAPSRETSLSRSMSSASQQMTNTSHADLRETSALDDGSGFQLMTRHGPRALKATAEVNTYGERPEIEKQKTVEAAYDKKEILDVFRQELPPPDFLATTPGMSNGYVQFVQHPNGDVAAHMWSLSNYAWDNIGHFSNIRKRTEGQLGGDRLKGETAYQKLQQHTLAYFRVLAKQREASVTGAPFGQDNIKSALPEPVHTASPERESSSVASRYAPQPSLEHAGSELARADPRVYSASEKPQVHPMALTSRQEDPFSTNTADSFTTFGRQPSYEHEQSARKAEFSQIPSGQERRHDTGPESTPTREALRDQLHKTVDIAVKRSLSQANLARTVLHDPMRKAERDDHSHSISPPAFPINNLCWNCQDSQVRPGGDTHIPTDRKTSVLTIGSVPDVDVEHFMTPKPQEIHRPRPVVPLKPVAKPAKKSYDDELRDWWTGGTKFARQEELFHTVMNSTPKSSRASFSAGAAGSRRNTSASNSSSDISETNTRILIPVYENLASYVQGPIEQRRDYWCQWSQPPEWCIDRGPNGNKSFFDDSWGQPPARVGRDPRYRRDRGDLQFGGLSPMSQKTIGSPGMHSMGMGMSRFAYGRY